MWAETFSYTLSEFVEAGIPVIAGRLGAQGERIARCHLGWTVDDIRNPAATLAILEGLLGDPARLRAAAAALCREEALVPIETMWNRYADAYRSLTGSRNTAAADPAPDGREYVTFLAATLAQASPPAAAGASREELQRELDGVHELLRSPRHRIADAIGNAIQKTPLLWPLVRAVTEAILRRRTRPQR
jgi:hypothetical protein